MSLLILNVNLINSFIISPQIYIIYVIFKLFIIFHFVIYACMQLYLGTY